LTHRIGLIADTHGLLRPEAERLLRGCDHIVHAGDIENEHTMATLPVTAAQLLIMDDHSFQPRIVQLL
jgi:uncharacterized protein